MVELALPRQLHALGQRAIREARARRSGTVEAEHLLLAILGTPGTPASSALGAAGLDYLAFESALDAERARSLAAAGIDPIPAGEPATPRTSVPGWGASIRDVLQKANKPAAKGARPGALEIELASTILTAGLGTVPRALAIARLDRVALVTSLGNVEIS